MNDKPSPHSFRLALATFALSIVAVTGFLGFQNYVNHNGLATPTLLASAVAVLPSFTNTRVPLPATNTPVPTITRTPSPGPSPIPSDTPLPSATPTQTLTPSPSPTSRPQLVPSLATFEPEELASTGPAPTAVTAIPTAVPTFEVPLGTTNVLLLGSDTDLDQGVGRTDTMIIVAINRDGPTASMVSLPRDLYVYIPGWTMNRLNTALSRGAAAGYPGGAIAQLRDTILYNFGIPIHFYAQIDFEGFQQGVDLMDGVEVAVSCELRDWRLKSPDLDPNNEENWEIFTLEPGIHQMDGDLALWYARSRRTTSDFDRGRRQQQLLRAMLNQAVDLNLLAQIPDLYNTYQNTVKTDMDIGRILQLASLAPAIRENGVQNLYIVGNQIQSWTVPETGAAVQLPVWENMQQTFRRLFLPPALNRATRPPITVEIINATGDPNKSLLAADNLAWYGFEPIISTTEQATQSQTTIQYFAQNTKGSFDWLLSWVVAKRTADVQLVTDTPYQYNYRVVLGTEYGPCRPQLFAPQIFIEQ
ncbi:MAG: LCP family protein [Chloroflexi bacterium]|nr:LCP family protein [Chloroflexota bacterium]